VIDKPTTQLSPRVFTVTQVSTVREKKNDGKNKNKEPPTIKTAENP